MGVVDRTVMKGREDTAPIRCLGVKKAAPRAGTAGGDSRRHFTRPWRGRLANPSPFPYIACPDCGVEKWYLVGLITRRSRVRIPPPLPPERALGPRLRARLLWSTGAGMASAWRSGARAGRC